MMKVEIDQVDGEAEFGGVDISVEALDDVFFLECFEMVFDDLF